MHDDTVGEKHAEMWDMVYEFFLAKFGVRSLVSFSCVFCAIQMTCCKDEHHLRVLPCCLKCEQFHLSPH